MGFLYTIGTDTKFVELQTLKPEETKMICPFDVAALNLLTEHDDVVTYINALMQVERSEDNKEKFWFPTPENSGSAAEHSLTLKRIVRELRELSELAKFDPIANEESRN